MFSSMSSGIAGAERRSAATSSGQQVRRDGVDDAEAQHAVERIAALLRDRLDARRLVERAPRLRHDLRADLGDQHAGLAALEDAHAELVLELLDRGRQRSAG